VPTHKALESQDRKRNSIYVADATVSPSDNLIIKNKEKTKKKSFINEEIQGIRYRKADF
jgi:hypothetical protein